MFESNISIIVELCISFILCLLILLYYSRKKMNVIIFIISLLCWTLNLFLIILIPYDVYFTQTSNNDIQEEMESFLKTGYRISYWSLFIFSWFIIPVMKEYELSGEFTVLEKLKISLKTNIKFFATLGVIGFFGFIYCLIRFGANSTLLVFQNFSLVFGHLFFFFLLSYGLIKYPKTLFLKFKIQLQITYLEWKANNFIGKLSTVKDNLINYYSKLKKTRDFYKDKKFDEELKESDDDNTNLDNDNNEKIKLEENLLNKNNKNSDNKEIKKDKNKKKIKKEKKIEYYLKDMEQEFSEFYQSANIYGIDTKKENFEFEDKIPLKDYDELIAQNKKIYKEQNESLRLHSRLRNCYMRWAKLNTAIFLSKDNAKNNNNIEKINNNRDDNIIIIKEDININLEENKNTDDKDSAVVVEKVKDKFIPLDDFPQYKIFYYSKFKKYLYLVFLILSIIASVITILGELFVVAGFNFIHIYDNVHNIVALHFLILIPLIYLISMSNYTLFKIKLSSYLFMYGPRQTDSVSLITFTSYLSRIYFAICINHIQAINTFSDRKFRTIFETEFGFEPDIKDKNFVLGFCRYSPIILFVFIILFYFNIFGKIGKDKKVFTKTKK